MVSPPVGNLPKSGFVMATEDDHSLSTVLPDDNTSVAVPCSERVVPSVVHVT